MQIAKGKVVTFDYSLKDEQGQLLDSSEGMDPLPYLHGAENIVAGLENALEGKSVGDRVEVVVPPQDGYGERNDALKQSVPRSDFAEFNDLAVGMQFAIQGGEEPAIVTVVAVNDESVTLDGNHPLAGVTLHFDVTVREIRDAQPEELAHGHVHGPGGHHH